MRDTETALLINRAEKDPILERQLLEKHRRLEKEFLYIVNNAKELRKRYPNKYIAVRDEEVKHNAKSIGLLLESINRSHENIEDFAIQYVDTNPKTC